MQNFSVLPPHGVWQLLFSELLVLAQVFRTLIVPVDLLHTSSMNRDVIKSNPAIKMTPVVQGIFRLRCKNFHPGTCCSISSINIHPPSSILQFGIELGLLSRDIINKSADLSFPLTLFTLFWPASTANGTSSRSRASSTTPQR